MATVSFVVSKETTKETVAILGLLVMLHSSGMLFCVLHGTEIVNKFSAVCFSSHFVETLVLSFI